MNTNGYLLRLNIFCRQQNAGNLTYRVDVLFTDEATCTRSGIFMIHNSHLRVHDNQTVVVILFLALVSK